MDTIFALSSGPVPSGLAVVRVSGPLAAVCLQALCGSLPEPRRAELRVIKQPADGSILDQGMVLWFPSPRSYTGQDVAEFHLHGGRAVVQAMIKALAGEGARYAEAGEFSRRAFLNGKLDLTQVEGLADLLAADTEAQRIQAVAQVQGALALRAEGWRAAILGLRAEIE
ncbi:MAG: tRNA uridine-5-carboxymethylaminomethyl(34) synthesis GTPase MnmE, partial [Pseudomonadota bacterium]|nr:tRNA uridine-5-carboxymethylaminomethyl(34) synthesis GTPase MnmE [Pseudomonadota bacterium]